VSELLQLFTRAAKLLREETDRAMAEHGVRVGQNIVLEALWETDGLTPGELAARQGMSTPTVVQTATRMQEAGLLERRPDPADARLVRLYLTERGRSVEAAVKRARRNVARRATAALSADEEKALRAALAKIIGRLE
jgi:MarR family transcriptional regulator, organic hydroperoxide resistance regulator